MDFEIGLSRIAKAIQVLGVIWAAGWVAIALFSSDSEKTLVTIYLVIGALGCAAAWGVAWIIRGFAGKR